MNNKPLSRQGQHVLVEDSASDLNALDISQVPPSGGSARAPLTLDQRLDAFDFHRHGGEMMSFDAAGKERPLD